MGNWEFVKAEGTINLFNDPSFALADPDTEWDFFGDGAEDVTREDGDRYYGFSCAKADFGGGTFVTVYQEPTVTATSYTLSVLARRAGGGVVSNSECGPRWDGGWSGSWDNITAVRDNWYRCVKTAIATAGVLAFGAFAREDGLLLDGMQFEHLDHRTTFCDGEQPGCEWLGDQYASQSERDSQSRDGGRIYDFEDYGAYAEAFAGTGMPPVAHAALDYTQLPGSEFRRTKIRDRTLILNLWVAGTSVENLHSLRQALIQAVGPEEPTGQQSFILRYSGADVTKEIRVRYEAGLESGKWRGFQETIALRLWAEDPMWYAEGDGSAEIDSNDTKGFKHLYGRIDGQWDDIGPPSASDLVLALAWGPDKCLYIGGDFTNWHAIANADYIVKWDPQAAAYSALGTGTSGDVYATIFGPDGDLYIAGNFGNVGGVADTAMMARWDGSAWNSVYSGATNGTIYTIAFDADGTLWAGGAFTTIGGDSVNRIAWFDGADWQNTHGAGADNTVYALALHPNGNMFAGGYFTQIGNRTAARIAVWDGNRWAAMGDGCNDTVKSLVVAESGTLYVGGEFTDPASKVVSWNGTSYTAMTDYFNDDTVNALMIGPDGTLYAAGKGGGDMPVPAADVWWDPDGENLPVWGAWRAEDVSDYEYSKTDLSGNGHHLVEQGGAMPWDTVNGWEVQSFVKRGLLTGFVPDSGADQTFLIQVTSMEASVHVYPLGSMNKDNDRLAVNYHSNKGFTYWNGGMLYIARAAITGCNSGVTSDDGYYNGAIEAGNTAAWSSNPSAMPQVAIGALHGYWGLTVGGSMYIQGAVIYDGEITAAQMLKVRNQMNGGWAAPASPSSTSVYVVARWDGTQWIPVDSVAPGEPYALACGQERLVGYDLYVGAAAAATEQIAGITTVNHAGTAQAYPKIVVARTGGTSATIVSISNETTGEMLAFDYEMLDGETVTIDLVKKRILSDFGGNVLDQMLAASAFGSFSLMPGDNKIAAFVETAGAPTVTAYMTYRDTYLSAD